MRKTKDRSFSNIGSLSCTQCHSAGASAGKNTSPGGLASTCGSVDAIRERERLLVDRGAADHEAVPAARPQRRVEARRAPRPAAREVRVGAEHDVAPLAQRPVRVGERLERAPAHQHRDGRSSARGSAAGRSEGATAARRGGRSTRFSACATTIASTPGLSSARGCRGSPDAARSRRSRSARRGSRGCRSTRRPASVSRSVGSRRGSRASISSTCSSWLT